MELYFHPISTYSQKVMIAFREKDISYTSHIIDLSKPEVKEWFFKLSFTGKIPYLEPKPNYNIPESTSIIEYLEDAFPNTKHFIPIEGGEAARKVRFMDRMSDQYLNDPVIELLLQKIGFRTEDTDKADSARNYIMASYENLNTNTKKTHGYAESNSPWLIVQLFHHYFTHRCLFLLMDIPMLNLIGNEQCNEIHIEK